jgi:hypothetical protein
MTLRLKKDGAARSDASTPPSGQAGPPTRPTQRIPLPHNSMFVMGPETNKRWLHGVNHDNRPSHIKSDLERAHGGERISLTFRHIGTFLSADGMKIYGQGAKGKTKADARDVVTVASEVDELLCAFGKENHESNFDWDGVYGKGFDMVHFSTMEGT